MALEIVGGKIMDGGTDVTGDYALKKEHVPYMNVSQQGVSYAPNPKYWFDVEITYDPPKKIWKVKKVGDFLKEDYTDSGEKWEDAPGYNPNINPLAPHAGNNGLGPDNWVGDHWIKTYTNKESFAIFIRFAMHNWDDKPEWDEPDTPPNYMEQYYQTLNKQGWFLLEPGGSMTIDGVGQYQNKVYVHKAEDFDLLEPHRKYLSKLVDGTPIESVGLGVVHPTTSDGTSFNFGKVFRNYFGLAELPLLWRTVGLKDKPIYDLDGRNIPHGEYYFIDPFAPFAPTQTWDEEGYTDKHERYTTLGPEQGRIAPIKIDNDRVWKLDQWFEVNRNETSRCNPYWEIPKDKWRDYLLGKKTMKRILIELANPDIPDMEAWYEYNGDEASPPNEPNAPQPFPVAGGSMGDLLYESFCNTLAGHFSERNYSEEAVKFGKLPILWLETTVSDDHWGYTTASNEQSGKRKNAPCMTSTDREPRTRHVFFPAHKEWWMQKKMAFAVKGIEPREEKWTISWSAPFGGKGQASLTEALSGGGWSASLNHSIWNEHHSSAELWCWVPNPRAGKSFTPPDTVDLERAYEYINDFPAVGSMLGFRSALAASPDDVEFADNEKVPEYFNDQGAPHHYDMAKDWKPPYDSMGTFSGLSIDGQPVPYNGYFPQFSSNGAHAARFTVRPCWHMVNPGKQVSQWNQGDFFRAHAGLPAGVVGANGCLVTPTGVYDIENIKKVS